MALRAIAALVFLLLILPPAASRAAGTEADCRASRHAQVRIRACTDILQNAQATQNQRARAYRHRGRTHSDAGAHETALRDFDAAIRLAPDDAWSYAERGKVYLAMGDASAALEDLDRAVSIAPGSPGLRVARGYAFIVNGDFDAAIADFDRALELEPRNIVALNNRGLAYRKKGDADRAIADFTRAIHLNPIYALAYLNRGYTFESVGKKHQAALDFRDALLINPTLTGAVEGLKRVGGKEPTDETGFLISEGRRLSERHCAWCHSIERSGDSANPDAPAFRDLQHRHPLLALRRPIERGIAAPHDEMPRFELSQTDIDSIVAYVNSLHSVR